MCIIASIRRNYCLPLLICIHLHTHPTVQGIGALVLRERKTMFDVTLTRQARESGVGSRFRNGPHDR
jgi:hypothetical protein